ncbi:hypothetical protein AB1Y20_019778 [Prymnesium parvum]|uniref:Uncharacterized protein n=1 Tax=Prymnesium parvum TaxID=97485 RepID=A0AB34JHV3_PRYPA
MLSSSALSSASELDAHVLLCCFSSSVKQEQITWRSATSALMTGLFSSPNTGSSRNADTCTKHFFSTSHTLHGDSPTPPIDE